MIPQPPDLYPEPTEDPAHTAPLSSCGAKLILDAFPAGSRIVHASFARAERLPCPVRVRVATPGGERTVYLRVDRTIGGVEREALVLPVLLDLGLPVPEVLAGPVTDPERPAWGPMSVLGEMPGREMLRSIWDAPPDALARAIDVTLDALGRLPPLTAAVEQSVAGPALPRLSLADELRAIVGHGGPWLHEPSVARMIPRLRSIVESIDVPLVFSSGDYNPGNLLWDGARVTGYLDFALSRFEDPHIGYAKYWTYDWYPLNRAGLVERYLEWNDLTMRDFAPRLAVRCLWTLQREIPLAGIPGHPYYTAYRTRILELLASAAELL
jgi:hypothetical protein